MVEGRCDGHIKLSDALPDAQQGQGEQMTTVNADRLTTSTGFPFVVTRKSKAAKFEQAVNRLMTEIAAGEESAEQGGWIDESEILSEFGAGKKA